MKVFLDTNVWIASFIAPGTCSELVDHLLSRHVVVTSQKILHELQKNLHAKFKITPSDIEHTLQIVSRMSHIVEIPMEPITVCRDSQDRHVLAAAKGAKVDCIVTGDQDLLVLKKYEGIPIMSPNQFWKFEDLCNR